MIETQTADLVFVRERLAELRDACEVAGRRVLALRQRCEDLDAPGGDLDALRAAVAQLRQAVAEAAECERRLGAAHGKVAGRG